MLNFSIVVRVGSLTLLSIMEIIPAAHRRGNSVRHRPTEPEVTAEEKVQEGL